MGHTPGFLSSGMSLHAINALRVLGSRYWVANRRAKVASWTRSSLFSFLYFLLVRRRRYCSASSRESPPALFLMLEDLKTIVSSISWKYEGRIRLTGPLISLSDVSGTGCGRFCCSLFSMVPSTLCNPASMYVNNFIAALIFPWKTSFAKDLTLTCLLRLSFEESRPWIVRHF